MAAIKEQFLNLGVMSQTGGASYRSPCIMYATSFCTSLCPPPTASLLTDPSSRVGTNRGGSNLLASGGLVVPRRTVAATSSVATMVDQSIGQSTGDYQVRRGEHISSTRSIYEVLDLLGELG